MGHTQGNFKLTGLARAQYRGVTTKNSLHPGKVFQPCAELVAVDGLV